MFDTAFSVVVLPAPFEPSSATISPARHRQREAAQHLDRVVVDDLDIVDFEDRLAGCRAHVRLTPRL